MRRGRLLSARARYYLPLYRSCHSSGKKSLLSLSLAGWSSGQARTTTHCEGEECTIVGTISYHHTILTPTACVFPKFPAPRTLRVGPTVSAASFTFIIKTSHHGRECCAGSVQPKPTRDLQPSADWSKLLLLQTLQCWRLRFAGSPLQVLHARGKITSLPMSSRARRLPPCLISTPHLFF
jgi:hypothetical protein